MPPKNRAKENTMDRIVSGSENKKLVVSLPIVEHPHVQIVEHHELMFNNSEARVLNNLVKPQLRRFNQIRQTLAMGI